MSKLIALFRRPASPIAADLVPLSQPLARRGKPGTNHLGIKTVIDAGAVVTGGLQVKENIIINGVVRGAVEGPSCLVLLKETGLIAGGVHAGQLYVAGEVHGDILAKFVRLFPTARVSGSISADKIVVDLGASIQCKSVSVGSVTIDQNGEAHTTPSAVPGDTDARGANSIGGISSTMKLAAASAAPRRPA